MILLIKFGKYHETPLDRNFPADHDETESLPDYIKRLQNYCSLNYFDSQITHERNKRERFCIFEQFQANCNSSQKSQFYKTKFKEIDCYYSDDEFSDQDIQDMPQYKGKKAMHIKSHNKKLTSDFNWNLDISQMKLNFHFSR